MRIPMRSWVALLCAGCWALPGASAAAQEPASPRTSVRKHFTPRDQQLGRYQHVPFDVPAGTTRIRVAYRYDKAGGAGVVDLGLFEPGPLDFGTKAFRGWSGGERSEITVGVDDATPGYWPGPIPAGRWHVMLGLYKVSAAGVDVDLEIETSSAPAGPTPPLAPRPTEPIRRGSAWYSGALHAHTHHSDGALPPAELARRARAEGLDFLAITDHNNTAHQRDPIAEPGLLVISGEEITTPGGHLNVLGLEGERAYLDFRALPGDPRLLAMVEQVAAPGVLFSVNHPRSDCVACSWTHDIPASVAAMEVANISHQEMAQSLAMWDLLLRQGRRIAGIGVSDWHRGTAPIGAASVRVRADELSRPAILGAIRAGRVVVMADATTPPPELRLLAGSRQASVGDVLRLRRGEAFAAELQAAGPAYEGARVDFVWRGEALASATLSAGQPARLERFAAAPGYLRAHVTTADGRPLAMTNPIWVEVAPE
ncbi:MAG: CehA/McbA family metallohydrolase [Vicinamibacteria bacterium]